MIWPAGAYYVVQDVSDHSRKLEVVAEADSKMELERYRRDKDLPCEIYKEQGQELYRLICERRSDVVNKYNESD